MTWLIVTFLACGSPAPTPAEVLAAADAHDGKVDHVVEECGGCGLGMLGDPVNAVQHEGYELHFCSSSCASTFEADPAAGLKRIEPVVIPGS